MLVNINLYCFQQSTIICYAKVDPGGLRYLLGDMAGHLFMLFVETETRGDGNEVVKDLKVEMLGNFSVFLLPKALNCNFYF